MSKYQESLDNLHDYVTEKLREEDLSVNHFIIEFNSLQQLIDERPRLIKALKDINELLERLTLEQKKSLGATVYTVQALIIETLEREGKG